MGSCKRWHIFMTRLITVAYIVYIINLGWLRQSLHSQISCTPELELPFSLQRGKTAMPRTHTSASNSRFCQLSATFPCHDCQIKKKSAYISHFFWLYFLYKRRRFLSGCKRRLGGTAALCRSWFRKQRQIMTGSNKGFLLSLLQPGALSAPHLSVLP